MSMNILKPLMPKSLSWTKSDLTSSHDRKWGKIFLFSASIEIAKTIEEIWGAPICVILIGNNINLHDELPSYYYLLNSNTLDVSQIDQIFSEEKKKDQTLFTSHTGSLILNALDISPNQFEEEEIGSYDQTLSNHFQIYKFINSSRYRATVIHLSDYQNHLRGIGRGIILSLNKEGESTRYINIEGDNLLSNKNLEVLLSTSDFPKPLIYLSNNQFYIKNLMDLDNPSNFIIQKNSVVLISGGNGKIGRHLTKFLASKFNCKVILTSRSKLSLQAKQELKLIGATAFIQADITDRGQVRHLWKNIEHSFGKISGIFHLSGVLDDKLFLSKTLEEFKKVIAPKFEGLINLDYVSKNHPLDFFVAFSSLSSLVGNIGQTDYASANALMDDFIQFRSKLVVNKKRQGLSLSINWGLWEQGGMSMDIEGSSLFPMPLNDCFNALEKSLQSGSSQLLISQGGYDELLTAQAKETQPIVDNGIEYNVILVEQWIAEKIYKTTKLKELSNQDSLIDHGVDSIAIVNLVKLFEKDLKKYNPSISLNKGLVFEYSTKALLFEFFTKKYFKSLAQLFPIQKSEIKQKTTTPQKEFVSASIPQTLNEQSIAVIGLAGRFPGADTIEEFWGNLVEGKNSVRIIPKDRWDWKQDYSTDPNAPGKTYGRHGGFLSNIKTFDPLFFGIAPSDAKNLDPQERLLLQTVYHSLEDAAIEKLPKKTGVFVAAMFGHYRSYDSPDSVIDSSFSALANRISYFFDFHGPSIAIDTMCSGSLTALHLALQSLRSNECEMAIVCGVNLMPHPIKYRLLAQGKFLSKTGKCHSFGRDADGYVPGEGVTSIVLKKESLALNDKDKVYGVILGSAINSGGKTSGFTVPSIQGQKEVIQQAISDSNVNQNTISYIEAHGTGTSLGDPIEIQALQEAYGDFNGQKCAIGTVKSNIGHLESSAGLAGVIKILLQMKHNTIAPTINCEEENPYLNINQTSFFLPHAAKPWNSSHKPLRAAISSFGAGGSNAHVILEQTEVKNQIGIQKPSFNLFCISGVNEKSLSEQVENLKNWLLNHDCNLYDLGYTLCCGRRHHKYRSAIIASTKEDLLKALSLPMGLDEPFLNKAINDPRIVQLQAIKEGYLNKAEIDFKSIYPIRTPSDSPLYAFAKDEYWNDSIYSEHKAPKVVLSNELNFENFSFYVPEKNIAAEVGSTNDPSRVLLFSFGLKGNNFFSKNFHSRDIEYHKLETIQPSKEYYDHLLNSSAGEEANRKIVLLISEPLREDQAEILKQHLFFICKSFVEITKKTNFYLFYLNSESIEFNSLLGSTRGLLKIIPMENPRILTRLIKLVNPVNDLSEAINKEIDREQPTQFQEVEIGSQKFLSNYEKSDLVFDKSKPNIFRHKGNYILTGGMGHVGKVIARYLAKTYQANLFILGSSLLDEPKINFLKELTSFSSKALYFQADLTDYKAVAEKINEIRMQTDHIDGILYSAGKIADRLLKEKTYQEFQSVFSVKAKGVVNLDEATKNLNLDFFVVFSSIASVFGNVGQSDYAMGNAFLDEFAKLRNKLIYKDNLRKGHTLSLNWPLWTEGSSKVDPLQKDFLYNQFGLDSISDKEGTLLLELALQRTIEKKEDQLILTKGNQEKIQALLIQNKTETSENNHETSNIKEIEQYLISTVSVLLGHDESNVQKDTIFGDLGFNSIGLQKFAQKINDAFGSKLAPNSFFTHNTIEKLSHFLVEKFPQIQEKEHSESVQPHFSISQEKNDKKKQANGFAIIGMEGIMPGAESLEIFWDNQIMKKNIIQPMDKRWPNRQYLGGLIHCMDSFDPKFFGMSAREAMLMDPQHRLFLEVAYNTFLDAGYDPYKLDEVGVFAGVQFNDYQILLQQWKQSRHPYAATGNAHALLANRVSYFFDFHGPSQTIDTACSSALIALRRAILSLENGECKTAIVGATSLLIDHEVTDAAKSMGVLSPHFRCATFDASADGYVRSEGVGCLLIKPLEDAVRDNDHCYGIIREVVENHGGKAHSLTAPNPEAQKALLLKAYSKYPIQNINYIEAHGTGTKIGDPIEIDALKSAWNTLSTIKDKRKIPIGSVKTHVGHLEPAAGIASLFKVLLSMKHKTLPNNLNFRELNHYIDIQDSPFYILKENESWEPNNTPRAAGISSFGFGGSNAHAIIEESPPFFSSPSSENDSYFLPLSAKNEWSLQEMQKNLLEFLKHQRIMHSKYYTIANIAYTLSTGRNHFKYRNGWIASNLEELVQLLKNSSTNNLQKVSPNLLNLNQKYLAGEDIDWTSVYSKPLQRLSLPGYTFKHQSYWFEGAADRILEEVPS